MVDLSQPNWKIRKKLYREKRREKRLRIRGFLIQDRFYSGLIKRMLLFMVLACIIGPQGILRGTGRDGNIFALVICFVPFGSNAESVSVGGVYLGVSFVPWLLEGSCIASLYSKARKDEMYWINVKVFLVLQCFWFAGMNLATLICYRMGLFFVLNISSFFLFSFSVVILIVARRSKDKQESAGLLDGIKPGDCS